MLYTLTLALTGDERREEKREIEKRERDI